MKVKQILKITHIAILFLCLSFKLFCKEVELKDLGSGAKFNHSFYDDLVTTGKFALHGSYRQFSSTQNLIFWGFAAGSIAYFIHNDERISKKAVNKKRNEKIINNISDAGILFNTPIVPAIFYSISRFREDEKMLRFTQEYTATLGLGLLESLVVSAIPVHQRPDEKKLTAWEKYFRGRSSFPSGHMIGFSALGLKAFQFYGIWAAAPPVALAGITAFQRVHTEKHYCSDVIASVLMTFLASEGVRMVSNYNGNNSFYEWIFIHHFNIRYFRKDDISGAEVSLTF